jgi:hypothetical protein
MISLVIEGGNTGIARRSQAKLTLISGSKLEEQAIEDKKAIDHLRRINQYDNWNDEDNVL